MRALMIGPEQKDAIDRLIARAVQQPITLDEMRRASQAAGEALLRWKRRLNACTVALPIGFLVTYTREQQPPGLCHHISISIDIPGKVPHPDAVAMICEAFEMPEVANVVLAPATADHSSVIGIWPEEYSTGRVAVNIVAKVH